ncbi:IDEAL domain-containing protein [Oceanobacillus manasiensis]|uniref:IDEAL domain-containing protein n=1 Tax=Oceanobacillus manasiensis TaxID=586413 RepID=UPI0005A92F66|nr:IDEAL domain-containing protein [Oceanobacillus manasiensis]
MVIIKSFLPFRIGLSSSAIYLKLSIGGFVVLVNGKEYHYVPLDATSIHVNRETGEVVNKDAIFVFQHGKEEKHISMYELLFQSDFLIHLQGFIKPYFSKKATSLWDNDELDILIDQLELANIKRSIDKALDERDEETFHSLLKML